LSGARYFGEALTIASTDHFSISKPESREALQHVVLLELIATVAPGKGEAASGKSPSSPIPKELPSGAYFDPETQLMWATADNGSEIGWNEAKEYARHLSLGGYMDWRLPTIEELQDLYDAMREGAYRIRNPFSLTGPLIWSSTKQAPGSGWFLSFENGVRLHKHPWCRQESVPVCTERHVRRASSPDEAMARGNDWSRSELLRIRRPLMARRLRVLNTCLYPGFRADAADREEHKIP
jgi:hypothetical protein